jgi:hypothetical protein
MEYNNTVLAVEYVLLEVPLQPIQYNLTLALRFLVTSWYLYLVSDLHLTKSTPSYNLTSLIPFIQHHLGIIYPTLNCTLLL